MLLLTSIISQQINPIPAAHGITTPVSMINGIQRFLLSVQVTQLCKPTAKYQAILTVIGTLDVNV